MISYKKRLTNEWVKTHSQLNIKAMINMLEHQNDVNRLYGLTYI